jgi:hypothetical protein
MRRKTCRVRLGIKNKELLLLKTKKKKEKRATG